VKVSLSEITETDIFSDLQGFGEDTTGGLGGVHYIVTDNRDYDRDHPKLSIPGTLRYGVEMIGKCGETGVCPEGVSSIPVWITSILPTDKQIRLNKPLILSENTTINGPMRIAYLDDHPLRVDDVSNVVIRNISFERLPGALNTSGQLCPSNSQIPDVTAEDYIGCPNPINIRTHHSNLDRIWIDHNEFSKCGDKCITVWANDRGTYFKGRLPAPDKITISNNVFKDSYYAVLVGVDGNSGLKHLPKPGSSRTTMYGNLFTNVYRRSPRAASGVWLHAFNNVVQYWDDKTTCDPNGSIAGFGSSANGGAQLLLENNYYKASLNMPRVCRVAVSITSKISGGDDLGLGFVREKGNAFHNQAISDSNQPRKVFDAEEYYSYSLLSPSKSYNSVLSNAGVQDTQ